MRIFLTGSTGQLGSAIAAALEARGDEVITPSHRELDLADGRTARAAVERARPDAVINAAAFTDVDGAEDDPAGALQLNGLAVRTVAGAAGALDVPLVHFSSDFVFDGAKLEPYDETDPPNPQSTYAMSKLLGEWLAASAPRHYVLRVESLFGGPAVVSSSRRSSLDRIMDAIAEGREVRAFCDRTVSPSYAVDVAAATRRLIERAPGPGLYHCVNTGCATWLDLAVECQRIIGGSAAIVPVHVREVRLRAARPARAALSNRKLAAAGITMPSWQDAIARCLQERFAKSGAKP